MNKELKTLKDFNTDELTEFYCSQLKAEAVKHYKAVKNRDLIIDVQTYIRWANNLTEEDLK